MATIALIYGRDESAKLALWAVLENLGHSVRDFDIAKGDNPTRNYNPEIIENLFRNVDAAVAALTPDEETMLKPALRSTNPADWQVHDRARQNVVAELALAAAILEGRVIEVSFNLSYQEIPSDWMGLNPLSWTSARAVAKGIASRLSAFGIPSKEPSAAVDAIHYAAPAPTFEESQPPYDFIQYPMLLPQADLNPPWPDQTQAWKDLGYEIDHKYVESRISWELEGFRPLIYKDPSRREYVLAVFDTGQGLKKMWLGRLKA